MKTSPEEKAQEILSIMRSTEFWQTKTRGSDQDEFDIYLACADDGKGRELGTGKPLKTFEEWLQA